LNKRKNIYWHKPVITVKDRWEYNGYKSCLLWFTGLSASGKSTIAHALDEKLHSLKINSYVLDGDNIRHGLNRDLGLSPEDRKENVRRIGEVSKLFVDAGLIVITAFISPYRKDRMNVRKLLGKNRFIEVFAECSISECERRDPKGLYKRARAGRIKAFTGIGAPYEEPRKPEIVLRTDKMTPAECVETIFNYLKKKEYIKKRLFRKTGVV